MGITKTQGFDPALVEKAAVLKALGHPGRLAIIRMLIKANSCVGHELVAEIPLAQPTISRHLAELRKAGLVKGTTKGTYMCYCIDPEKWMEIKGWLDSWSTELKTLQINEEE